MSFSNVSKENNWNYHKFKPLNHYLFRTTQNSFVRPPSMDNVRSESAASLLFNGVVTGSLSALLNPLDRALHLSVKEKKSILTASIWKNPYQGVTKAFYSRMVSYGVFFSLSDIYKDFFKDKTTYPTLCGSVTTVMTTVALSQPISVIKMYQWNHNVSDKLISSGRYLVRTWGWRVLFKASIPTLTRDVIFTTTYMESSERLNPDKKFTTNLVIASLATALSSPFNYYRSRQFFNFNEGQIPIHKVIRELIEDSKVKKSWISKIKYIGYDSLNIGLGTARVGLGMALSDKIYCWLKTHPARKRQE